MSRLLDVSSSSSTTTSSRIAFGSCNEQDLQNNMWPIIAERHPTAFIWGGDAIYAGTLRSLRR